jgi:hypothetical protein
METFARRLSCPLLASFLGVALVGACMGDIGHVSAGSGGRAGGTNPGGGSGGSASGSAGSGGSTSGGNTGAGGAGNPASPYLPARIRRLTNAEYDASVQTLLGTTMGPSTKFAFPPDARQGPTNSPAGAAFTVNDAQRVDPVLADKLDAAAQALVTEARGNGKLATLSPCANATGAGGEACARTFLQSFGARVYRRAVTDDEVTALVSGPMSAYHLGADGYTYADGIDLLTRILLQSPVFLYVTELGEAGAGGTFTMTSNEIASSLSYLLTSAPPDGTLMGNAASGMLATPEGRETEARRLLATPVGRARFVRVVREWLGIDDVAHREKAQSVYPDFAGVAQAMEAESAAFIDEVLTSSTGTLAELLTADWTIVDAPLATVYGVTSAGAGRRTMLTGSKRRGILNQGAFLSVYANTNSSHPVFRGVAIMRRIACLPVPDPGALGIVVSFPAADSTKTTRARFEAHALNAQCANCHSTIDALGFAFENFDGMGKARATENNLPINTSVTLAAGSDLDGTYADSNSLTTALADSESVKTCLARQIFHSTAARSDSTISGAENAFLEVWRQLPAAQQGRLADVLIAFVRSPQFVQRRAE